MRKLIAIFLLALPLMGCGEPGSDLVGKYEKLDIQATLDNHLRTDLEFLRDGSGTYSSCCLTTARDRFTYNFSWTAPEDGRLRATVTRWNGEKRESIGSYSFNGDVLELTNMGDLNGSYTQTK